MIRKLCSSAVIAGLLVGALATSAFAAPTAGEDVQPQAKHQKHHREARDIFGGKVVAISESQLTVRNKSGEKTFLRTEKTEVRRGHDKVAWSEIEVNSHVSVRFEERDGKLFAKTIHLGWAHVSGKVESVNGNTIIVATKDGKDVRVIVNAQTKFIEGHGKGKRQAGSLKDIHAGMHVIVAGRRDANGSFDARVVMYWGKDRR